MLHSRQAASLTRASLRHVASSSTRSAANSARASGVRSPLTKNLAVRKPSSLALTLRKPSSTYLQRYSTYDKPDKKHEEEVENERLEPHPEEISATSSVHQVFHEKGVEEPEKDVDMLAGVKSDFVRSPHEW